MKIKLKLLFTAFNILSYEGYFPVRAKDTATVEELHIADSIVDEMGSVNRIDHVGEALQLDVPSVDLHRVCRLIVATKLGQQDKIRDELHGMTKPEVDSLSLAIEELDIPLLERFRYVPVRPADTQLEAKDQAEDVYLPGTVVKKMHVLECMRSEIPCAVVEPPVELDIPSATVHRICRLLKSLEARNFKAVNAELATLNTADAVDFIRAVDYLDIPLLAERYGQAVSCVCLSNETRDLLNRLASGQEIKEAGCMHRNLIRLLLDVEEGPAEIERARLEPLEESRELIAARKARYRNYFASRGIRIDERLVDRAGEDNSDDRQYFLFAGADPNYKTATGNTALIWAAKCRNQETALKLLEAKAEPNARSNYGDTALHAGATWGMRGLVRSLLDAKADPNQLGTDDEPPVTAAIKNNHEDLASDLIRRGADVDAGVPGSFALTWAVLCGRQRLVDQLLKHGAKTDVRGAMGDTPLQLARRLNFRDIEDSLVKYGASE